MVNKCVEPTKIPGCGCYLSLHLHCHGTADSGFSHHPSYSHPTLPALAAQQQASALPFFALPPTQRRTCSRPCPLVGSQPVLRSWPGAQGPTEQSRPSPGVRRAGGVPFSGVTLVGRAKDGSQAAAWMPRRGGKGPGRVWSLLLTSQQTLTCMACVPAERVPAATSAAGKAPMAFRPRDVLRAAGGHQGRRPHDQAVSRPRKASQAKNSGGH